jgi:hypothetical protein
MKRFKVDYYGRIFATEYIEAENEEEAWKIADTQKNSIEIDPSNIHWIAEDVEEE